MGAGVGGGGLRRVATVADTGWLGKHRLKSQSVLESFSNFKIKFDFSKTEGVGELGRWYRTNFEVPTLFEVAIQKRFEVAGRSCNGQRVWGA